MTSTPYLPIQSVAITGLYPGQWPVE